MQSCKTHLTVFSLAVASLLGVTGSAVRADNFTWDNSCGDNKWFRVCDFWAGDPPVHYTDNNWDAGYGIWPVGPPGPGIADDVNVGSGFVILNGSLTVNSFTSSGVFRVDSGLLHVTVDATYGGLVDWLGGGFGAGAHYVDAGLSILGPGSKAISGGAVNNADVATWTDAGTIYFGDDGVFNNLAGATFDAQSDAVISRTGLTGDAFNNAGTVTKSGGSGATRIGTPFNNTGVVNVLSGRLEMAFAGTSSGAFNVASGTSVDFTGGTHTLQDGASITGQGFGRIPNRAAVMIPNLATVTAENFSLLNGTLRGLGTLSVSDALNWSGGGMREAGITRIENTAALNISGNGNRSLSLGRTVDNFGAVNWTDAGTIYFEDACVFNNLAGATFDAQGDAVITRNGAAAGSFNNAGTFTKSAGTGVTQINSTYFTNTGAVEVRSGTLQVSYRYTQTGGATTLNGGDLSSGAWPIDIQGGRLTGAGGVNGHVDSAGEVSPGLSTGTINITGAYEQFTSGVLTVELAGAAPGEFDLLNVTGSATLDGTLNVTLIDAYVPGDGEAFTILTANTVTGTFASENLPVLPDELVWGVSYEPDRVTLVVGYDCNGNGLPHQNDQFADFNGDGDLDLTDYAGFAGCMTAPCGPEGCDPPLYGDTCCVLADVEPDGDVDLLDFSVFQRAFGG